MVKNEIMKIKEILNTINHRPWSIPSAPWKFYQEWNNAIFLHWKIEPSILKSLLPDDLELDLFEGSAWVSLVAFDMHKIRPRSLPSYPPISNFHEINIRTYVSYNGKPGVTFLSIEGAKKVSCKVAKAISELPYRYASMVRTQSTFESHNKDHDEALKIDFKIGEGIAQKNALDFWLTERYALFQQGATGINAFEIHHLEWPLFQLEIHTLMLHYPHLQSCFQSGPDLSHYSTGVQVLAWDKVTYR